MNNKHRFSRIIEVFINESRRNIMDYMFGKESKIKIKKIDYSTTAKLIHIDIVVILGETIDTHMFESDEIIKELVKDALEYISPNEKIMIKVSYDV